MCVFLRMRDNYDKVRKEKESLIKTKDSLEKSLRELTDKTSTQSVELKAQLDEANERVKSLQSKVDELNGQLAELENERANHQKLIKEYSKLEQRFEKVRNDLLRYSKSQNQNQQTNNNLNSGTSLSSSTTSFNQHTSELESLIEELEQDTAKPLSSNVFGGSSSVTSNEINNGVANFEANKLLYMTANGSEMDIGLVSKLQRRIAALEMEKKESFKLKNPADVTATGTTHDNNNNSNNPTDPNELHAANLYIERLQHEKDFELIKSQELELENQKLREDLNRLRDLIAENQSGKSDSIVNKEMVNQFDALNEELQRRRDECIQLKTLILAKHRLMNKSTNMNDSSNADSDDTNPDVHSINTEGNEFEVGYNTQKILNRILENQINEMKRNYESDKAVLVKEVKHLRDENDKQHDLIMQNLPPESLAEATYKNEIMKLTELNLVIFHLYLNETFFII